MRGESSVRAALIGRVCREELRYLAGQRLFRVMALILGLALCAALVLGALALQEQRAVQQQLSEEVRQQWVEQPDRHPHRVAHYGTFAFRPPPALGLFDPGVDRYVGNSIFLEAHRQNPANFAAVMENTTLTRFGELSPAFLLQYLVPLLLVVLAGTAVTREREHGTALLLRAQGLGLGSLLAGKTLAYALEGTCGVVLVLLASAAVLAVDGALGVDAASRLLALGVVYTLFLTICSGLGVACSALCRNARQAMLAVTAGWLLLALMLPRAVPDWIQAAEPLPTRVEFAAAVKADAADRGDSHNPEDSAFEALRQELLDEHGVDRVEELPVNFGGLVMVAGERRDAEAFQRQYERFLARLDRQDRLLSGAAWASPAMAVNRLSALLSGTDRHAYVDFQDAAEDYRYRVMQELNELHAHEIDYEDDRAQRISSDHWAAIPPFEYSHPTLTEVPRPWAAVWPMTGWVVLTVALLVWIGRSRKEWS